nr:MAG TPA: hypothetical protein [Siphoviridae sp. ctHdl3]
MDIKYLIEILPDFLSYFAPGAIAIGLYNILFLKSRIIVFLSFGLLYIAMLLNLSRPLFGQTQATYFAAS